MKRVTFSAWLEKRRCACSRLSFENGRYEAHLTGSTTQWREFVPAHVYVTPEDEDRYLGTDEREARKHLLLPWS